MCRTAAATRDSSPGRACRGAASGDGSPGGATEQEAATVTGDSSPGGASRAATGDNSSREKGGKEEESEREQGSEE